MSWTVPRCWRSTTAIRVRADLGWHVLVETLVRIDGIDAPELATAAGKVARDYLTAILPAGSSVTVVSKVMLGSREKYSPTSASPRTGPARTS